MYLYFVLIKTVCQFYKLLVCVQCDTNSKTTISKCGVNSFPAMRMRISQQLDWG